MYLVDDTRIYERKSELKTAPLGPFKIYKKGMEVSVAETDIQDVVEVTFKDSSKGFVRKIMLTPKKSS